MRFREEQSTGYMYAYELNHPCAGISGKILEHVLVMYNHIGRELTDGECVHHIDRDKKNNDISNLRLMTKTDHIRLHAEEDKGTVFINKICPVCSSRILTTEKADKKYCSNECAGKSSRLFEVSEKELHDLVWSMPTTEVSKIFGVSDSAIGKRCKLLGVSKPPRGYWRKVQVGSSI